MPGMTTEGEGGGSIGVTLAFGRMEADGTDLAEADLILDHGPQGDLLSRALQFAAGASIRNCWVQNVRAVAAI